MAGWLGARLAGWLDRWQPGGFYHVPRPAFHSPPTQKTLNHIVFLPDRWDWRAGVPPRLLLGLYERSPMGEGVEEVLTFALHIDSLNARLPMPLHSEMGTAIALVKAFRSIPPHLTDNGA